MITKETAGQLAYIFSYCSRKWHYTSSDGGWKHLSQVPEKRKHTALQSQVIILWGFLTTINPFPNITFHVIHYCYYKKIHNGRFKHCPIFTENKHFLLLTSEKKCNGWRSLRSHEPISASLTITLLLPSSSSIINSTLIGFSCLLQHKWEIPWEWEFAYWNKSASNYSKIQAVRKELIQRSGVSSDFSHVLKIKLTWFFCFKNTFHTGNPSSLIKKKK